MINDSVDLAVNLLESLGEWPRDGFRRVKGRKGGAKDPGVQLGEEQRYLVAVGGDQVAVALGHSPEDTLETEPAQVVGHLAGSVSGEVDSKISRYILTESTVGKPVGQVQEQDKGSQQGHDSGIPELQPRRPLTIGGDGRLHHPVHTLLRQRAILAHSLDIQQTSIDLS